MSDIEVYTVRVTKSSEGLSARVSGGILKKPVECGLAQNRDVLFRLIGGFLRRAEHTKAMTRGVSGIRTTPVDTNSLMRTAESFTAAVEKAKAKFMGKVARIREINHSSRHAETGLTQSTELIDHKGSVLASISLYIKDKAPRIETTYPNPE